MVEGDSVGGWLEGSPHVADPVAAACLEAGFDAFLAEIFASLNAGIEVVDGSMSFLESMVGMEFPGIALEPEVVGVAFDGEPYFDLIRILVDL